jgi:hypothetical protein
MRRAWILAVIAAALAPQGCRPRLAPSDVPAVLVNPGPGVRRELARTVSRALGGAPVTLADSALTVDDHLIVDRTVRRDAQRLPLDGRATGRPDHFRLVTSGARCVLVHQETGRRWPLKSAACAPR